MLLGIPGFLTLISSAGPSTISGELQQLFVGLDADRSGTISREELTIGLRAQGYNISDAEVQQLLDEVDVDNSGFIDFDEFMATLVDWGEVGAFCDDIDKGLQIPSTAACFATKYY